MNLLFGTGGTPNCSPKRDSISGIKTIAELKLDAMELEFVQGVKMKRELAEKVKETAEQLKVLLTAHAPYFINLNSTEKEKVRASIKRIVETARIGALCGAVSITFHPGFIGKDEPKTALTRIVNHLKDALQMIKDEGINIQVRPETTGKPSQFGSLEDTILLCAETGLMPCIDFAHLHAREKGRFKTLKDFTSVLEKLNKYLGKSALYNLHIHISGISYTSKGERKHLNLKESDMKYQEFLKSLIAHNAKGIIICESPNLEEDAKLLKTTYKKMGGA